VSARWAWWIRRVAGQRQSGPGPGSRRLDGRVTALGLILAAALITAPLADGGQAGEAVVAASRETGSGHGTSSSRAAGRRNLEGHGGPVHAIVVDRTGRRALTGSFDYSAIVWDLTRRPPTVVARLDEHEGWIKAVAFLPDGKRVLTAGGDGGLYLWQIDGPRLLHRFAGHRAEIADLAASADGRWAVTAGRDRTVRVWDIENRRAGPVLEGHTGPVNGVCLSGDGTKVYSASYDGTIRQWDRATGAFERIVYRHGQGLNAIARIPGTEQLLFGALDGAAGIVDAKGSGRAHMLEAHDGPVLSLAVIAKPGLAAVASSGRRGKGGLIRVWRIGDWKLVEEYRDPYGPVWAIAFVDGGTGVYYGGLNDFAVYWQVSPRKPFELAQGRFPRRFQVGEGASPGALQFARKCSLCHTLKPDGRNRAGPTLYGLFGRPAGSLAGYPYSKALRGSGIVWSEETVTKLFALGPEHYTPGSKMPLQRIKDPKKVEALVAFLKAATRPDGRAGQAAGN